VPLASEEGRAMTGYSPEFDWNPRNDTDHSIVVCHQPAIAVYINPHDEVCQQDQCDDSDDHFVFVTRMVACR
jgi:hypothetical protein